MQASSQPPSGVRDSPASSRRCSAVCRAATRADRLPIVPPATKQPPAVSGQRSSDASQAITWFSAWIAPAPTSHRPAKMLEALVASSKAAAERVGADGT